MPNASNALVQVEAGQALVAWAAMTDSGDQQTFTLSGAPVWSSKDGKAAELRPNGIVAGSDLITPHATNDTVSVAAFTAYSQGVLRSVSAGTLTASRGVGLDVCRITSITMTSAGALAAVAGVDGTAFSETRGADGGPPELPADSVELGQVRLGSITAGAITAAEIYQVVGQHVERFDFPVWSIDPVGQGQAAPAAARANAHVRLASALPKSHASATAKKIYAQVYTPIFGDESRTLDFTAAETTHSVSSTQYYGGSVASSSESLGQGSFTALLADGVTDGLIKNKNQTLTVRYYPDRSKSAYVLTQGKLGVSRSFPVSDQIQATVTISAERASAEFAG